MKQVVKRDLRWLAMLASMAMALAIAVLSLMPVDNTSVIVPGSDKLKHFVAYLALATSLTLWLGRAHVAKAFILALGYGILMEFAQALAPTGREASVLDAVADAIGAGAGVGIGLTTLRCWLRM